MKSNGGLVGIMVSRRSERTHVLSKYSAYNRGNLKLFSFTPSEINWEHNYIIGVHRHRGQTVSGKFPFPQVIFNRCYKTDQHMVKRIESIIGINKCFNHINQFNKYEAYEYLSEWLSPNLPETVPYQAEEAIRLLNVHKVIYLKPCYGNSGIGVYRAELKESGEIHIGHHHFSPEKVIGDASQFQIALQEITGSTPYIIQQGVDVKQLDGSIFDIRVLVQKNLSGLWSTTNVISRIAHKGCYNSSICEKVSLTHDVLKQLYTPDEGDALIGLIYDLSLRTAEIMELHAGYHLGEISVDFALDNDGRVWMVEVNGKPQKDLYNGITERKIIYARPLEYAHYLLSLG